MKLFEVKKKDNYYVIVRIMGSLHDYYAKLTRENRKKFNNAINSLIADKDLILHGNSHIYLTTNDEFTNLDKLTERCKDLMNLTFLIQKSYYELSSCNISTNDVERINDFLNVTD